MAKRVFKADCLSLSSIRELQKQLEEYQDSIKRKLEEVVREVAKVGLEVAEREISKASFTYDEKGIESGSDTEHNSQIKVTSLRGYAHADLIVEGRELLFIEFGAGVYYNGPVGSSPHPKGEEFGFLIGSYGKGHGAQKVWGYYNDSGDLVLTHGTRATMPMYNAFLKMYEEAPKIVKRVFGK